MTAAKKKTTAKPAPKASSKPTAKPVATKPKTAPAARSTLGLEGIGDLASLLNDPARGAGEPVELPIDDVIEDPNQPRQTFPQDELEEMAASIVAHNVKVPISVHRGHDGKYIINDGARRYRGSKMAGKKTIPSIIAKPFSLVEQIVVNKDRVDAPPKDKAHAFARELKEKGLTQRQLAAAFGMRQQEPGKPARYLVSEAYISQHLALLDLPKVIDAVFESGRCTDVTLINELLKAYKKDAEAVAKWLSDDAQELTRGSVKMLREFLDDKSKQGRQDAGSTAGAGEGDGAGEGGQEGDKDKVDAKKEKKEADPEQFKKAIVKVEHDGRHARILLTRRPPADGFAWLKYDDDGHEFEANLSSVRLVALIEG